MGFTFAGAIIRFNITSTTMKLHTDWNNGCAHLVVGGVGSRARADVRSFTLTSKMILLVSATSKLILLDKLTSKMIDTLLLAAEACVNSRTCEVLNEQYSSIDSPSSTHDLPARLH